MKKGALSASRRDCRGACQSIQLTAVRNGSEILKVVEVYLNRSGHTALEWSVAGSFTSLGSVLR